MEMTPANTKFVIVATGKAYPIKDELKSLGFQWNKVNKVWYHLSGLPSEHNQALIELMISYPSLGISFRHFELSGNNWNETEF